MKSIVIGFAFICLVGCMQSLAETAKLPALSVKELTDSEVSTIISETMRQIHTNLKGMKADFPQLSVIDMANVTSNRFDYSKGWVSESKREGVTFEKDGCGISVWTKYPAQQTDVQQLVGSPFLRLGNGKYLKFWRLVRTEQTEQAKIFRARVNEIISKRIYEMLEKLGHNPKDWINRLPENKTTPNQASETIGAQGEPQPQR